MEIFLKLPDGIRLLVAVPELPQPGEVLRLRADTILDHDRRINPRSMNNKMVKVTERLQDEGWPNSRYTNPTFQVAQMNLNG